MNRLHNALEQAVEEMIDGYIDTYPNLFERVEGQKVLLYKGRKDGVSILIGAGAGNEPWPIGYVGKGLADACVLGDIFTAPAAGSILKAIRTLSHDAGVLCIATNHAGDVLNFELVSELAELEGIQTRQLYISDDVDSSEEREERRGIAGVTLVLKILSAARDAGLSLEALLSLGESINNNLSTASVTTSPAYIFENGKQAYDLPDGTVEYGMGFNGEMGKERTNLPSANSLIEKLTVPLILDLQLKADDEIVVFLNVFQATTTLEECILLHSLQNFLKRKKIKVFDTFVQSLFPTQGAGGFSLSFLKMQEKYRDFYKKEAYSPLFYKREME